MIRRLIFELMYWLQRTPWDTGITPPEVIEYLENHPTGHAIDLGCGSGTNALTMARRGWQVTGIDFSNKAVRIAQQKTDGLGLPIEIRQGDVTKLENIEGPFDLALDIGCFHSLTRDQRKLYAERLAQLINPQGTYLLYSWLAPEDVSGLNHPNEDEVRDTFSAHFDLEKASIGSEGRRRSAWFTFKKRL